MEPINASDDQVERGRNERLRGDAPVATGVMLGVRL